MWRIAQIRGRAIPTWRQITVYRGARGALYPRGTKSAYNAMQRMRFPVKNIWVFCDRQAEAIRVFPGNGMEDDNKGQRDLFQKYYYFNGKSFSFNGTAKGFEDGKRRIPSCPDPLHN
ncbi:LOB domain-containing protein 41 [Hibiscus syriacus]|uniref:LOB domain-containing protein 41 n=1 Tax=Hibiscus syriacus TaxID=106335 RepID=A0A6A2WS54_HIBSY|nr:LOB domain-containing protein 41 [Hibiscus syriacus]